MFERIIRLVKGEKTEAIGKLESVIPEVATAETSGDRWITCGKIKYRHASITEVTDRVPDHPELDRR